MKNTEISRIITMLHKTYDGAAWHGASVMEVLNKLTVKQAFHESVHIHRICELVQHMITWRIFACKRLEGEHHYEVTQKEDWKNFADADASTWESVKDELAQSQQRLTIALEHINDDLLAELVEGKAYDYYTMLHGVIQHDLYHLGEIALLATEFND
jgi:hypothetical protein